MCTFKIFFVGKNFKWWPNKSQAAVPPIHMDKGDSTRDPIGGKKKKFIPLVF